MSGGSTHASAPKNQGKSELRDGNRLDSGRDLRLIFGEVKEPYKRWEQERGLPTNRLPGKDVLPVFA